jgi:hypothetical protein
MYLKPVIMRPQFWKAETVFIALMLFCARAYCNSLTYEFSPPVFAKMPINVQQQRQRQARSGKGDQF